MLYIFDRYYAFKTIIFIYIFILKFLIIQIKFKLFKTDLNLIIIHKLFDHQRNAQQSWHFFILNLFQFEKGEES